ncbi:hypothetical protein XAR_2176 [Xanthomonas citri pv. glycines str. 8ra]|nr:hypothetical protein XAR_2176 [Xanthomonas citri pv. glycines str. 8ra]
MSTETFWPDAPATLHAPHANDELCLSPSLDLTRQVQARLQRPPGSLIFATNRAVGAEPPAQFAGHLQ